ncbi:phenylalanyl-tRNA ligase subunit beta [Fictibacillus macauensis ZFHKF-1]|uniref:Phenylalanine--tRNA ligase beta subunit n=1 Tax=Fictibacillus macauensis ZFHKF-1 TaxID=1196324 RepID=I8UBU8_9BACL|nr:phenylalanine--tRNA ligase subunit beta [Fictibacillus macauensis]EIT84415.1 phenylalanyl-tRNA ligase subunit beta [Fictibacillus macauensis ZFHKF-1]
MLVSYNWLKEYVEINVTAEELADKITKSGIEVEMVEALNKGISGVVVGHVLQCEQHPNADKLRVCQVDIGEAEPAQIVCGAPNVAAGQKVAVATVGAVLPGNFKIKKAKLRGEASHGMICSLSELGVETKLVPKEYATGIFVMPSDAEVGSDALAYLNLDDHVLELGLTPNRADALNMIGVAYEVAAILNQDVILPQPAYQEHSKRADEMISVAVESAEDNPYYGAMIISNVTIAPSPLWMQNRLMAAGIRPINNVVDITNYVLIEYGQPLHAFDYDRFGSKEILVRRAKDGEEIVTLDDATRTLTNAHLVITNGTEPMAVAGVMGGAVAEVSEETTTVLLEAAYFNGQRVRTSSKDLGLRSESSARFEKGIDRNRVYQAAKRAADLMERFAGGQVLTGIVEAGERTVAEGTASVTKERINQLLGTNITDEEIAAIFARLRFEVSEQEGVYTVTVPSRRPDITIDADLVEEVGRIYGYDKIPTTYLLTEARPGGLSAYQTARRNVMRYLEGAGLYQAVTYALTTKEKAKSFTFSKEQESAHTISVSHPMSEDRSALRRTLVPQLLEVVRHNHHRSMDDLAIFEMSAVFFAHEEAISVLPEEKRYLSGALTGLWESHPWQGEKKKVDFFVVKGILEGLFMELGLQQRITYENASLQGMHPGRTALIKLDSISVGFVGQLHPVTQKDWDLNETYVFELDFDALMETTVEQTVYETLPRFPSMTRDIALVVDRSLPAGDLSTVIYEAGGSLLKECRMFDLYEGDRMEEGKKSLAFSLKYFDPERTLTDEEVSKAHENILRSLEERFGATLRN